MSEKKHILLSTLLIFILLINFTSCKTDTPVDIQIKRYDIALFNIDKANIVNELQNLQKDYPFFIGEAIDSFDIFRLYTYLNEPINKQAFIEVEKKYPHLNDLEKELGLAFAQLLKKDTSFVVPDVYTYISGYDKDYPIKYLDSLNVLIIALDMYLGQYYHMYPSFEIPDYKAYRLRKESIVVDCMGQIANEKLKSKPNIILYEQSLLDRMVYEGKILYFLDVTLPKMHDSLKIGFKTEQLEFCKANEGNIWRLFLEQNFLYQKDRKVIKRFIDDGPFTPSFASTSPARTGIFIGWQIIRSFMKEEKISIDELFAITDSQYILSKSKYKPKK